VNPREVKFCQRYHVLGNATQAAKEAGYSAKTAYSQGGRLLKRVEVKRYLATLQGKSESRALLTAEELDRRLEEVINFDLRRLYRPMLKDGQPVLDEEGRPRYELIPLPEWPEDIARTLAGCDVTELFEGASGEKFVIGQLKKWKRHDLTRALELYYKRRGLLVEKHELDVPGSVTITIGLQPPKKPEGQE
jgi:phage terminase small subunit